MEIAVITGFGGGTGSGIFTKRFPRETILYYEGSLLLKTFMPLRDDSGKLQPDRRMFTDGQSKPRAENITGNGPQLMTDFRTNVCRLPGFCNLDLNDRVKVAAVQNMNPLPHMKCIMAELLSRKKEGHRTFLIPCSSSHLTELKHYGIMLLWRQTLQVRYLSTISSACSCCL